MNIRIRWKDVDSSAIKQVAYDRRSRTLYVRFQNDQTYEYPRVGKHRYYRLMREESKGRYLNEAIVNRNKTYRRVA